LEGYTFWILTGDGLLAAISYSRNVLYTVRDTRPYLAAIFKNRCSRSVSEIEFNEIIFVTFFKILSSNKTYIKVKVKLSLCTPLMHVGEMEVWLHSFQTSALDEYEWQIQILLALFFGKATSTHWICGQV
jgi:hypothetical protein